jgi:uncharacterized protein with von Willebrand factor type A (vWA) domain
MITTPKNIKNVLKKLKTTDNELAEFCINNTVEFLKSNGYDDAKLWASSILPVVIGELGAVEEPTDMETWLFELEGIEKDVVESVYDTFSYLTDALENLDPKDVRDTIVYAVSKTLESMEKIKYRKSYG